MITYHSTRGSNSTLSFKDVVLSGVADDKGLFLPNGTTLENLSNLTQEDLSYEDFVKIMHFNRLVQLQTEDWKRSVRED